MRTCICVSELGTSRARIHAQSAAVIIAADEADYNEPALLFQSGTIGPVVTIELDEGDLLFETANLAKAIEFVTTIKGRSDFKLHHTGLMFSEEGWPEDAEEEPSACELLTDDDDDPANWWKRGQQ